MPLVAAKFVPRVPSDDQKHQRVDACTEIRHLACDDKTPDSANCYFSLFPKMKLKLKERRFDTTEEIQAESQKVLDTQTEKDFQDVQKW
jgi:hypothetical protein